MLKFLNSIKNMRKRSNGFFYSAGNNGNSASGASIERKNNDELLEFQGSKPKKAFRLEDLKEGSAVRRLRNGVALDRSGTRWLMKKPKYEKEGQPSKEFGLLNKPGMND